jgi:hypothetical protein
VVHLSPERAERLERLANERKVSEEALIESALDLLFYAEGSAEDEIVFWSGLSEGALAQVWDNDADAAYDNWRELYGVPEE